MNILEMQHYDAWNVCTCNIWMKYFIEWYYKKRNVGWVFKFLFIPNIRFFISLLLVISFLYLVICHSFIIFNFYNSISIISIYIYNISFISTISKIIWSIMLDKFSIIFFMCMIIYMCIIFIISIMLYILNKFK